MSLVRAPGPAPARPAEPVARRGRPPARNEILRAGRLGGLDPAALAARHGTPFFAYDLDVVGPPGRGAPARAAGGRRPRLRDEGQPQPRRRAVISLGSASARTSPRAGSCATPSGRASRPERIVVTGPGKRDDELLAAVEAGVRAVTVESVGELRRLASIAEGLGRTPAGPAPGGGLGARPPRAGPARRRRRGGQVRDGCRRPADRGGRGGRLALARAHRRPRVRGLQRARRRGDRGARRRRPSRPRAGSRPRPASGSRSSTRAAGSGSRTRRTRRRSTSTSSARGWPRWPPASPPTRPRARPRVLLEPGRFLVGPAGAYVARVVDRKAVGGQHVVILDGGIHHVLRPALVGQEHRVRTLTGVAATPAAANAQRFPVTVAGPLCSGLDVFAQSAVMAAARRRRPRGRARRRGVRRHGVDAVLPVARVAARDRDPRRPGLGRAPAHRARGLARLAARGAGGGGPTRLIYSRGVCRAPHPRSCPSACRSRSCCPSRA